MSIDHSPGTARAGSRAGDRPIVAHGLERWFGSGDDVVKAVDGVDLEVEPGEIFGFLGPNGAGKSTTVRMLTTLLRPTGGEAFVAGFDVVHQADDVRRNIGVALQDAAIDPLMTGTELLMLQAILYGLPKSQHHVRANELLERVGLTAASHRRVGTYSGGMRRRLDLALSLIHEPSVLFLDEPTTGLDPTSRVSLWEEIRRLNNDGTTVLLTTQYLEEADQLAERIAIIDRGVIVRKGRPAELKAEVGSPTLFVSVPADMVEAARAVLGTFGELRPSPEGTLGVGLAEGPGAVSKVVRELDDAGVGVRNLELHEPSLDDVYAVATGHRLEGAGDSNSESGDADSDDGTNASKRGRRRKQADQ
jgi:ABC-2 type transport system ATP-binding protein